MFQNTHFLRILKIFFVKLDKLRYFYSVVKNKTNETEFSIHRK